MKIGGQLEGEYVLTVFSLLFCSFEDCFWEIIKTLFGGSDGNDYAFCLNVRSKIASFHSVKTVIATLLYNKMKF